MSSAHKKAQNLANQKDEPRMSLDDRLNLLRQSTGVKEYEVKEYQDGEVIRNAIQGVRKSAAVNQASRTSPNKIYSAVKSRIAGNMKSIKKT